MDIEPKFTFISIQQDKKYPNLENNTIKKLIEKWGLHLSIQNYLFNETFHEYHKYHLAEEFFKSDIVAKSLKTWTSNNYKIQGFVASKVETKQISCSVVSMSFFDKLKDPKNNIVYESGSIRQRYETEINGIMVSDNLRSMLIDEESDEYSIYSTDERDEFIFKIFQMLVLGGEYCQYEDYLQPYLDCTKKIYKDFVKVYTEPSTNDLAISTMILQVVAERDGKAYFPNDPDHLQNIGYLLVDSNNREITTLIHQYKG
ncbi:hypothetical protein HCN44_009292 [Aphidius gifuensis]|uniref:Cilia- and flagella-associated protein 300 n=2 Tax=Aphidius gifuensis TaxID=684658 RepID=A0A835CW25_APHGI|nr:hypothetical protein HCN44_009292 [Aphidius gifuensis]